MSVLYLRACPLGTIDVIMSTANGNMAKSLAPGDSTEGMPAEVIALANSTWTAPVASAYATATATPALTTTEVNALAKEECRRRIYDVVSPATQMNLAHAKAGMVGADALMYAAGYSWIASMRAAWRTMAANGVNPRDDASWPAVPTGFEAWVAAY